MGVSMIRSVPNSWTSPSSVLNGCPASATSSPMRNTRGSRRISSAIASLTASPYVSSRSLMVAPLFSRVHVLIDFVRLRVWRRQRELDAGVDLRLHVVLDALEDAVVGEPLRREPPGQGLQRVVVAHPLLLFLSRAILTVDVAHVVAVVAVGLALEEGGTFAPTRALDEAAHRGIDCLHVLAIDALRVDAECLRTGEDLAGDGFAARRVLTVEV